MLIQVVRGYLEPEETAFTTTPLELTEMRQVGLEMVDQGVLETTSLPQEQAALVRLVL
jgi:hypothetical protein